MLELHELLLHFERLLCFQLKLQVRLEYMVVLAGVANLGDVCSIVLPQFPEMSLADQHITKSTNYERVPLLVSLILLPTNYTDSIIISPQLFLLIYLQNLYTIHLYSQYLRDLKIFKLMQSTGKHQQLNQQIKTTNNLQQAYQIGNQAIHHMYAYLDFNKLDQQSLYLAAQTLELQTNITLQLSFELLSHLPLLLQLYDNYPTVQKSHYVTVILLYFLSKNMQIQFGLTVEKMGGPMWVLQFYGLINSGNFFKVFLSCQNPDYSPFRIFLDRIMHTIRQEIARSSQKAYKSLKLANAIKLFHFEDQNEMISFIEKQQGKEQQTGIKWRIKDDRVVFEPLQQQSVHFNSEMLIKQGLTYAYQIQKIV